MVYGLQHFKHSGVLKNVVFSNNDLIKDNFCKENNIKLYRISYKDKEIINSLMNILTSIKFYSIGSLKTPLIAGTSLEL
jgi:hypothetical protein